VRLNRPDPFFPKYIKKGDKTKKVETIVKQAEAQLKKYSLDLKLGKSIKGTTLIKLVLVFSGTELEYIGTAGGDK